MASQSNSPKDELGAVFRFLLDENLDERLAVEFPPGSAVHVKSAGWAGISNGQLLDLAVPSGFAALVTADKHIAFQQNLAKRSFSLIVVDVPPVPPRKSIQVGARNP